MLITSYLTTLASPGEHLQILGVQALRHSNLVFGFKSVYILSMHWSDQIDQIAPDFLIVEFVPPNMPCLFNIVVHILSIFMPDEVIN